MKTDWKVGDVFCYCIDNGDENRGWFDEDTIVWKGKYVVESVHANWVSGDGWAFYFDEIKPVIQVRGDLQ